MLRRSCRILNWLGGTATSSGLGIDVRSPAGSFVNILPEGTQARGGNQSRRTAAHFMPTAGTNASYYYPPEARQALVAHTGGGTPKARSSKWNRALRAEIYDELLKLPLRFALHEFDKLERHLRGSVTGDSGVYTFGGPSAALPSAANADVGVGSLRDVAAHPYYAVAGRASSVGYAPPLGPADPLDVIPFFVHRGSNGQLPGKVASMHQRNLMPAFVMKIEASVEGDLFRFEEELMKIFPTKKIFVRSHCVYVYNVGRDGLSVLHHWLLGLGF